MIILKNHVEMDFSKVSNVLNWFTLKKVKNVQTFLEFAKITKSLTSLIKKNII